MAVETHWGDALLRDDLGLGPKWLEPELQWGVSVEEGYRSPQAPAEGTGNFSVLQRFRLVSRHTNYQERQAWQLRLFYSLHGGNLTAARELWYRDTALSPLPFSLGFAVALPPRFPDDENGQDDTGPICVTEYAFRCDVLPIGDLSLEPDPTVAPPIYAPNLWLPNAYGLVLRRKGDDAYVRVTRDFALQRFSFAQLDAAPLAAEYDTVSADVEWPNTLRGFGLFTAGTYDLVRINDLLQFAPMRDASAGAFVPGYSSAKGLAFGVGYGPILRTPDNRRARLIFNSQNELALETP